MHDNMEFDLNFVDNYCPSNEDLESFFDGFDDDVQRTTETRRVNIPEATPPSVDQTADTSNLIDSTSRLPPLKVEIPTSLVSESDLIMTQAS